MTRTLFGRLFSPKTLVQLGFAVASLHFMGSAYAQGATASANPPAYGSAWAATRTHSDSMGDRQVAVRTSKAAGMAAPAKTDSNARVSSPRTGG